MTKAKRRKKPLDMTIGQRLKKARLAKGLTLRQVERSTGIGVSHLSQIENDLRNVNVAKLEVLAASFGCSPADFFPRRGEAEAEFFRAKPLSPSQREVLRAMEDDAIAEHLVDQARMKVRYKAAQTRRKKKKE